MITNCDDCESKFLAIVMIVICERHIFTNCDLWKQIYTNCDLWKARQRDVWETSARSVFPQEKLSRKSKVGDDQKYLDDDEDNKDDDDDDDNPCVMQSS